MSGFSKALEQAQRDDVAHGRKLPWRRKEEIS
jgi:hypothetical protein